MQDLIGVRIVLYFIDDINVIDHLMSKKFKIKSTNIWESDVDTFGPHNYNLIVKMPKPEREDCYYLKNHDFVDPTFEVQVRSVLSEGWHEVDHDLRYKRESDWEEHEDLGRAFNSIMATLENCDRSILRVLDDLAKRHFKEGSYEAMLRSKFRLRFDPAPSNDDVWRYLDQNPSFAKEVYQSDRSRVVQKLVDLDRLIPITPENILFIVNRLSIDDQSFRELEPSLISSRLDDCNFE